MPYLKDSYLGDSNPNPSFVPNPDLSIPDPSNTDLSSPNFTSLLSYLSPENHYEPSGPFTRNFIEPPEAAQESPPPSLPWHGQWTPDIQPQPQSVVAGKLAELWSEQTKVMLLFETLTNDIASLKRAIGNIKTELGETAKNIRAELEETTTNIRAELGGGMGVIRGQVEEIRDEMAHPTVVRDTKGEMEKLEARVVEKLEEFRKWAQAVEKLLSGRKSHGTL